MNIVRITFLLVYPLFQVISVGAQAAQPATLVIPEALDIVSVDNNKYSKPLFSDPVTTLKLEPGQHQIVLEYDMLFEVGHDDHDVITSEPFQITFSTVAGEQYYIKVPVFDESTLDKARVYARKPVIEIIRRADSQSVAAEITYREFDGTFSTKHTKTSKSNTPKAASTNPSEKTNQASSSPEALKMLEYWWQQASEQQRKQFLDTR